MSNSKIVELNNWDAEKHGKIVLCHGHFNVIHPGHIRYLKHAKELGETLIVSILGNNEFKNQKEVITSMKPREPKVLLQLN